MRETGGNPETGKVKKSNDEVRSHHPKIEETGTRISMPLEKSDPIRFRQKEKPATSDQISEHLIGPTILEKSELESNPEISNRISTRVWLSSGADKDAVRDALFELLDVVGFDLIETGPEKFGSWTGSFLFGPKRTESRREIRRRLRKIERALESALLDKVQAGVTQAEMDAASKLITSLQNEPAALINFHSILLIKGDGKLVARSLSVDEQRFMETNPSVMNDAASILDILQKVGDSSRDEESGHPVVSQAEDTSPVRARTAAADA